MNDAEAAHLFRRMPDDRARCELFHIFRPLAIHLANRYRHRGVEIEDLQQVAFLGLVNAIDRFDPNFGSRFISFAVPTITGEIKRYFRDRTWAVRPPRSAQERHLDLRRARVALSSDLGRPPTVQELASELDELTPRVDPVLDPSTTRTIALVRTDLTALRDRLA